MAYFVSSEGKLLESDDDADELAKQGVRPATTKDIERHNSDLDYEDSSLGDKVGETARAFGEGATRQLQRVQQIGDDSGLFSAGRDPYDPAPEQGYSPSSPEARGIAERHPIAAMAGNAAPLLPAMALGGGAGIAADAVAGGVSGEAEQAWQDDREFSAEAAWQNVGAGLILGGGLMAASSAARGLTRIGRNLLTEGEHAASARAASDLLEEAGKVKRAESMTADDIAKASPDDLGVSYLRDNADKLTDQLATKQAAAAQELLDSYGEISKLRPNVEELKEVIPDNITDQARWVTHVRQTVSEALADVPGVSKDLSERIANMGEGRDPAQWFTNASELGDELAKARVAASKTAPKAERDIADELAAAPGSPVSLAGKSMEDLGVKLTDPSTFKQETLEALRTGKGGRGDFARDFASSGRVNQAGQLEQGIQIELGPKGPRLVDGRHRLMVGREQGQSELYGQIHQGARAPGKAPIYEGMIPIAEREAAAVVDPVAAIDRARGILMDGLSQQTVWGDAAVTETQRASAYARRAADHIAEFEDAFTTKVGKNRRADPAKFRAFMQSDEVSGAIKQRVMESTMEAARATADAAVRFGRPKEAARIAAALDAIDATGSQAAAVRAARGVSRATAAPAQSNAEAALGWLGKQAGNRMGNAIGGAVGYAVGGGPVGALIGSGVGQVAQQGAEALAARLGVFKAVKGFSTQAARNSKAGVHAMLNGAIGLGARASELGAKVIETAAPAVSGVTAQNFQAVREHIDKLAHDPRYFGEAMGASFGNLPEAAPEVYRALSQKASQTASYLISVAPGGKQPGPFGTTFPVGEDDLWEFQQRVAAVTDPQYIKSALIGGTLTAQAMDAFQEVAPTQYRRLQMDVYDRLGQLKRMGVTVHEQAREQLDMLLDLDGGGEVAMTWHAAEQVQRAQQLRQQQLQDKKLNEADSQQAATRTSGALSTLSNGASALART